MCGSQIFCRLKIISMKFFLRVSLRENNSMGNIKKYAV